MFYFNGIQLTAVVNRNFYSHFGGKVSEEENCADCWLTEFTIAAFSRLILSTRLNNPIMSVAHVLNGGDWIPNMEFFF